MNLAELFRHETDLQALQAGQTLFNEGEKGELMYVLISGTASIFVRNRLVETAEAGAMMGEMAMIEDAPRTATVIARTDCMLLPIGQKRFNFLVQQTPNFALHVMRVIADRLRRADAFL
ncbi:cyclic nucleotide-binding domain-containing protein [Sideroxydans lithotrophicus]|uniref:Putative transcriptional regulator, Crp/Fnr family n=1 Tax=Sideroxydans lithotrophicus (strain ES-1) TaxID=580332 RepID=D5CR93_SIDLE|nr:cyclic nucleotide-binding domain-containing protein [Sideroxydans lithotrophicus]ADE11479.1 putative transcriptional regulator, Crp/Fnr family [Sideroxydans lithotrophicus ES-1]